MLSNPNIQPTISIDPKSTIINDLQSRDPKFLLEVYDKYAACLFSYISKILPGRTLAEVALETTFEKLLLEINKFDDKRDDLFIWLLNIARIEAVELLIKSHSRQVSMVVQMGCRGSAQVDKYISLLDPLEKTIFSLVYYRHLSFEQIAEILKLGMGVIKLKCKSAYNKIEFLFPQQQIEGRQIVKQNTSSLSLSSH